MSGFWIRKKKRVRINSLSLLILRTTIPSDVQDELFLLQNNSAAKDLCEENVLNVCMYVRVCVGGDMRVSALSEATPKREIMSGIQIIIIMRNIYIITIITQLAH